jgi:ferredoxin
MQKFRYLENVTTLKLDEEKCIGCGMCEEVCPHTVFKVDNPKARFADRDACIECGACAANCPVEAITVTPGVGCAAYIIQTWIKGKDAVIECC